MRKNKTNCKKKGGVRNNGPTLVMPRPNFNLETYTRQHLIGKQELQETISIPKIMINLIANINYENKFDTDVIHFGNIRDYFLYKYQNNKLINLLFENKDNLNGIQYIIDIINKYIKLNSIDLKYKRLNFRVSNKQNKTEFIIDYDSENISGKIYDIFDNFNKSNNGIIRVDIKSEEPDTKRSLLKGGRRKNKLNNTIFKGGDGLCYIYDEEAITECKSNPNPDSIYGKEIAGLYTFKGIIDDLEKLHTELYKNPNIDDNIDDNVFFIYFVIKFIFESELNIKADLYEFDKIKYNFINLATDRTYEFEKIDSSYFNVNNPKVIKINSILDTFKTTYANLYNYIMNHKEYMKNFVVIDYKHTYNYTNYIHAIDNFNCRKEIDACYFKYNSNIVTAFQYDYIKNADNTKTIIEEHMKYLENLSLTQKRIIQDYTKHYSFDFYAGYISIKNDINEINKYFTEKERNFGDSFYATIYLIHKLYLSDDSKYSIYKSISDKVKDHFKTGIFIKWLLNDRLKPRSNFIFDDIDPVITFEPIEWGLIIDAFIYNVNFIIKNAPKNINEINCYRGSGSNYMNTYDDKHEEMIIKKGDNQIKCKKFISTRISSYSLAFHNSYYYAMKNKNPNTRCVYKFNIIANNSVLFVAPLSFAAHELEILSPTDTEFLYEMPDKGNFNEPRKVKSYNNIFRKCGLFSNKDRAFNSYNTILYSTPEKKEIEIDLMSQDIFKDFKINHTNVSYINDAKEYINYIFADSTVVDIDIIEKHYIQSLLDNKKIEKIKSEIDSDIPLWIDSAYPLNQAAIMYDLKKQAVVAEVAEVAQAANQIPSGINENVINIPVIKELLNFFK